MSDIGIVADLMRNPEVMHNPIAYMAIQMWRHGTPLTQALAEGIKAMAEANNTLSDQLLRRMEREPPQPYFFGPGGSMG